MLLDSKLNFSENLKTILQKTNKTIGLLHKLETLFPRALLVTICKSLSDATWIMVIYYMIKLSIYRFNKKW